MHPTNGRHHLACWHCLTPPSEQVRLTSLAIFIMSSTLQNYGGQCAASHHPHGSQQLTNLNLCSTSPSYGGQHATSRDPHGRQQLTSLTRASPWQVMATNVQHLVPSWPVAGISSNSPLAASCHSCGGQKASRACSTPTTWKLARHQRFTPQRHSILWQATSTQWVSLCPP